MKMNMRNKVITIIAMVTLFAVTFTVVAQTLNNTEEFKIGAIITYKDGTTTTYPSTSRFDFSQTIVDGTTKEVSKLQIELYAKVDYVGDALAWRTTGDFKWTLLSSGYATLTSFTVPTTAQGTTAPPKGTYFAIASATLTAGDLESLYTGWADGSEYILRFETANNFQFTIDFAESSATKMASATTDWQFDYKAPNSFYSLTLSWNPIPYY